MSAEKLKEYAPLVGWLLAALGLAFSAGAATRGSWSALPARVSAIEARQDQTEKLLRFLVCSVRATNKGQDPTQCDVLLVELPDMLPTADK